jgi:hypothetical protein
VLDDTESKLSKDLLNFGNRRLKLDLLKPLEMHDDKKKRHLRIRESFIHGIISEEELSSYIEKNFPKLSPPCELAKSLEHRKIAWLFDHEHRKANLAAIEVHEIYRYQEICFSFLNENFISEPTYRRWMKYLSERLD